MEVAAVKRQKGQALVELTVSLAVLILTAGALLFLLYYAFSFHLVRIELQEALLCLHNRRQVSVCQKEFTAKVEGLLPVGAVDKILLEKRPDRLSGLAVFRIEEDLAVEDLQELELPLIPEKVGPL